MAEFTYTFDSQLVNTKVVNGKLFVNDVLVVVGSTMVKGDILKAVANNGYRIQRIRTPLEPYLGLKNVSGTIIWALADGWISEPTTAKMVVPSLKSGLGYNDIYINFEVNPDYVEPEPEPPSYDYVFTQNDIDAFINNNAKLYINDVLVVVGSGFVNGDVVKAVANSGYEFNDYSTNKVTVSYSSSPMGGRIYFNKGTDKTIGLTDLSSCYGSFNVVTNKIYVEPIPDYVIQQSDLDPFINANAKLYINDVLAVVGTKYFKGDVGKAIANDGYLFNELSNNKASVSYRSPTGGYSNFDINEIGNIATSNLVGFNGGFSVVTKIVTPNVAGFNNVYNIDDDQLRDVTQSRFITGTGSNVVDNGKYILGLINLPFNINQNLIIGTENIKLGSYDTGINARLLNADVIKLDLGVINVPKIKNNLLDFKNTVAILHLPYSDSINIDIDYVIGYDISIEYLINLYDGIVTINVISSKINGLINTSNVDMGITIPFSNIDTHPSNNDPRNVKLGGFNGVLTPHIEILRNDAVLENGFFTIPIIDESALINQIGFVKVDEIELMTSATMTERNKINSLLTSGVILK